MTDDTDIASPDRPGQSHRSKPETSVSDFSSSEYWSNRFTKETSFEWLLPSEQIIPFIIDQLGPSFTDDTTTRFRGLHIGCGTSDLGGRVQAALRERYPGKEVEIVDADYVADSISTPGVLALDCLDERDVLAKSPEGGWDMIMDKSTADAISCGPLIRKDGTVDPIGSGAGEGLEQGEEPLSILLRNMSKVTHQGVRWISVSYSSTRFDLPHLQELGWKVISKRFLASTSMPEGRRVKDEKTGEERVVWEPETGVWGWVLERV